MNNTVRALHINCNYITTKLHQELNKALTSLGVKNDYFVPTYDISLCNFELEENVKVKQCFNKNDRFLYYFKQKKIKKCVEDSYDVRFDRFDIIHAHTLFTDGNVAMRLSEKIGCPYIVTIRNTDVNDFFKIRKLLRKRGIKIMRNAAAIVFLSKSYMETVLEKYIPNNFRSEFVKKAYIIPNGIDPFWFDNKIEKRSLQKQNSIKNKTINITFVGKINRNKNIVSLKKAKDLLNIQGYNINIFAAGKIENARLFKIMEKDENIIYEGELDNVELCDLYRKSHMLVVPSYRESFGLVYAEAMTQGLPVIYSKGQGFDGQFQEGCVGYSVDPADAREIATAIKEIVVGYDKLSKNCLDCSCKFMWNDIALEYIKIYLQIMEEER